LSTSRRNAGAATAAKPAILVRFVRRSTRDEVYFARQKLNSFQSKIYINDDLPAATRDLLKTARQLVKEKKLLATWTRYGTLHIKKLDNSVAIVKNSDAFPS
jgi:hypothetical protein